MIANAINLLAGFYLGIFVREKLRLVGSGVLPIQKILNFRSPETQFRAI